MQITKKSFLTGIVRTKELDITIEQLKKWQNGMLVQDAFPNLSLEDREFIMTGATSDDWDELKEEE